MVHGQQAHLIEVDHLLHRLHELEAETAAPRARRKAFDLHVFRGVGDVAGPRGNPVPEHASAQHVGDEAIA